MNRQVNDIEDRLNKIIEKKISQILLGHSDAMSSTPGKIGECDCSINEQGKTITITCGKERVFGWKSITRGTIEDYIKGKPILLNASGTMDENTRLEINEVFHHNEFDCLVDRSWNIEKNNSINIIGYKIINL